MHTMTEKNNGSGATYTRLLVLEQKVDSHMEADEKFQTQSLEYQAKVEGWIEKLFTRINENQSKNETSFKETRNSIDSMKMPLYMGIGIAVAIPTAIELYRLITGR